MRNCYNENLRSLAGSWNLLGGLPSPQLLQKALVVRTLNAFLNDLKEPFRVVLQLRFLDPQTRKSTGP